MAAMWRKFECVQPAMNRHPPTTQRPTASCALQTSEKAGNLIAKRPEREFSLGAATVRISAAGVLSEFGPLWGLELSLNGNSPPPAAFQYGECVLSTY